MEHSWKAEIANNPQRDYDLCVELWEADEHRATLQRDGSGTLVLTIRPSESAAQIPAVWLVKVLQQAEEELPRNA